MNGLRFTEITFEKYVSNATKQFADLPYEHFDLGRKITPTNQFFLKTIRI